MRVFAQCLFIALAFAAATAHGASPASLQVEARSAAVGGGVLVQDIGIESLGGVFTVLLERRRAVPCEVTETFTTGADNQKEIEIRLFRGVAKLARDAKPLGRFAVSDLPRAPRGTVRVAVTISVGSDGTILLAAQEQAGRVVHLVRKPVARGPEPKTATERDRMRSDRAAIKKEFGALYGDVAALLFEADPIGINFKDNTDEYEPEVDTILPRLSSCSSPAGVEKVVHEEFVHWFDRDTAGPPERYRAVAKKIWERYKARR